MEDKCLVSIVIPSYKPGDYIYKCLDSINNQTLDKENFEVIIILNGEKEPYFSNILSKLKKDFTNLNCQLIYSYNKGVSYARNFGIENSKGEFVTFIDDDDIISNNYLEKLLSISDEKCIGCSNSITFTSEFSNQEPNFLTKHFVNCKKKRYSQFTYRGYLSPPYAKLIHRNIIYRTRFKTNLKFSEDSVFCFEITPRIQNMVLADEDCIYYINNRRGSSTRGKFILKDEISQLFKIELYYLKIYLKNIQLFNLLFVGSRILAAVINTCSRMRLLFADKR